MFHVLCPTTSRHVLYIGNDVIFLWFFGRFPPCFIQVYLNLSGRVKLGCLAQAMVVAPKDTVATPNDGVDGMDELEGEVDMEIEARKNTPYDLYQAVGHHHGRCSSVRYRPHVVRNVNAPAV